MTSSIVILNIAKKYTSFFVNVAVKSCPQAPGLYLGCTVIRSYVFKKKKELVSEIGHSFICFQL